MAKGIEGKKSFLMYHDYKPVFDTLNEHQTKRLINAMFLFDKSGNEPDFSDDPYLYGASILIFSTMQRNIEKYIKICEQNAENGRNGGRPPKSGKSDPVFSNPSKPIKGDKDTDKYTDIERENEFTGANVSSLASSLIVYLNEKTGSTFNSYGVEYRDMIRFLLEQGYTESDIRKVIDRKSAEWLPVDKMRSQLTPAVLFNPSKFDGYLNAPVSSDVIKENRKEEQRQNAETILQETEAELSLIRTELDNLAASKDSLSKEEWFKCRCELKEREGQVEQRKNRAERMLYGDNSQ